MAFTAEQHREYRRKLRSEGICQRCHKEKDSPGLCKNCRADIKRRQDSLIKLGLCPNCGAERDDQKKRKCCNCSEQAHRNMRRELK